MENWIPYKCVSHNEVASRAQGAQSARPEHGGHVYV